MTASPLPEPIPEETTAGRRQRQGALLVAALALIALCAILARLGLPGLINTHATPAPTPTPTPPVVTVLGLRDLAELATVEYHAVAEVQNERIPDDVRKYLGGREKLLMLVYGDVKAGFDLSKLTSDDLWTDGRRVQLHLPAPEILSTTIDWQPTHIVDDDKSFLVGNDPNLQSQTLEQAQALIEQAALEGGVADLARQFGRVFFENHLRSLGFTEVRIEID